MNRKFKILHWDGFHFGAVLTYWEQENTVAGTVWRFVMDQGQTLVAVPYQTPERPAATPHCVPERIEPILAGGLFGSAVRYAASKNVNLEGRWTKEKRDDEKWPVLTTWEELIHETATKEFAEWKEKEGLPEMEKVEAAQPEARKKRDAAWKKAGLSEEDSEEWKRSNEGKVWGEERGKISKPLFAPLDKIQKSKAYKAEKVQCDKMWAKIEAGHRKLIEKQKATREKEMTADALEELRGALAKHGAKKRGKKWLQELYDFIRQDVCGGNVMSPSIGAAGFQQVVSTVGKLTGTNITESLFMECEPWKQAHESGAEGLGQVRWVAVFPDGRKALIESLEVCIHNGRDVGLFEKVKPSEEERKVIERVIVQEKQISEKEFDRKLIGEAWKIMTSLNLSDSEWTKIKHCVAPKVPAKDGKQNKWDLEDWKNWDEKETYPIEFSCEELRWIFDAKSKKSLLQNHPEMKDRIRTTT